MNAVLFPKSIETKDPLKESPKNLMKWNNIYLNVEQKRAVVSILRAEGRPTPFIIFGPPGTGKTVTIVEAILQVYKQIKDSHIIACTALNTSADLLAELLLESKEIPESDLIRLTAKYRLFSQL